ncbi:pyrroline-5-carboxylate reductase domain protein, partial [Oesophagostomum dentatum]
QLLPIGYNGPIVRLFPNTAVAIGSGASILCAEPSVSDEVIALVSSFASKVGLCLRVDPRNFNAYGAISGSGPAWVYMFIESLADGGVFAGCSRETALKLAAQTVMVIVIAFHFCDNLPFHCFSRERSSSRRRSSKALSL